MQESSSLTNHSALMHHATAVLRRENTIAATTAKNARGTHSR